jgi:HEAT repeat protein
VVRHEIMVTAAHQTFDLALPAEPLGFRFDEGGWLLGTITTDQTPAELALIARHDLDFTARWWALRQLDKSTDPAARDARHLVALNDANPHMRSEALRQLGSDASSESMTIVRSALEDPVGEVRASAIGALAHLDSGAVQATAVALIEHDPSAIVQVSALQVYDPAIATQGTALLVDRLRHGRSLAIRQVAAQRLLTRPDAAGLDAIEAATDPQETRNMRTTALDLLVRWPDKSRAIAVATRSLTDGDPLFAADAARQLGAIGGEAGRASLRSALAAETRVTVRAALTAALAK